MATTAELSQPAYVSEKPALPYIETATSFAEVEITEAGVDTASFLEACDGLVGLFDLMGNAVFSFVQADLRSNTNGVRTIYNKRPSDYSTLEQLVQSELDSGCTPPRYGTGTNCLRMLLRGMVFIAVSLRSSRANEKEDLQTSFKKAYDEVLKKHHNFAIRAIVSIAIKAVPTRDDFYARIAQGATEQQLETRLQSWLTSLEGIVEHLEAFYERKGLGQI